jgi:isoaspartyl peptidase/L-asparaginase-like protein (Ntn-hydrolase superfamily)
MPDYVVIATWPFGQTAVKKAAEMLAKGAAALDAAIAGAQDVEDDPSVHSVGFAGLANAIGNVALDACVMDGATLNCGAVAGLENIRHPAALARLVMEKTPHILLVGQGAQQFALQQGFPLANLHTPESVAEWLKERPRRPAPGANAPGSPPNVNAPGSPPNVNAPGSPPNVNAPGSPPNVNAPGSPPNVNAPGSPPNVNAPGSPPNVNAPGSPPNVNAPGSPPNVNAPGSPPNVNAPGSPPESHDTVTVLARDQKGNLAGVCTTSGLAHKLPGRVGDSPLIGHGLYVDNQAGAAGGTGVGEEIIRIGGSLTIVEAMRSGKSAQEACELAIRKVNATAVRRGVHPARVAFLAVDAKGNPGAAATPRTNFQYAVGTPGKMELLKAKEIEPEVK